VPSFIFREPSRPEATEEAVRTDEQNTKHTSGNPIYNSVLHFLYSGLHRWKKGPSASFFRACLLRLCGAGNAGEANRVLVFIRNEADGEAVRSVFHLKRSGQHPFAFSWIYHVFKLCMFMDISCI